jgi:Mg2+-importing ATPase
MLNLLNYKVENLADEFGSDLESGLSTNQIALNKKKYGLNRISKEENSAIKIFLSQFNVFCFLLIFSCLFSLLLKEFIDATFIAFFVVLDVSLGFYQEYKSDRTAKLLERYSAFRVTVIRDGHKNIIDHEEVLPGDIIEIKAGDIIPADLKLIDSNDLYINESVISGESRPVFKSPHQSKDADPVLLSGTAVVKGFGTAIAVYTASDSRIGHISKLSTATSGESVYEKEAKKLSSFILKLVSVSLTGAVIFNYFFNFDTLPKFLLFSIALAVTVIPEALPLVVTFSLSNGALHLYNKKVLVKRLSAIEDMGGIDVLCTDKTGTLTENKLRISDHISFDDGNFLKLAYFSVNQKGGVDSFDEAILKYTDLKLKYKELSEIPFDPSRKRSSKLVEYRNENILIVKGAFEIISKFDHISEKDRSRLLQFNKEQGDRGNRVLLFGYTTLDKKSFDESDEKDLKIVGAIAFEDPIRFSTYDALNTAKNLNLEVKILTGDAKEVSYYVAEKIGLISSIDEVVTSKDLEKLKGEELRKVIFNSKVFCRVSPEEKYEII